MSTALDKPVASHDKTSDGGRHEDPFGMKFFAESTMKDFESAFAKIKTMNNGAEVASPKLASATPEKEMNFTPKNDPTMEKYFAAAQAPKPENASAADAKLAQKFPLPWEQQEAA